MSFSFDDADKIIRGKLIEICGFSEGIRIGNAVVPGILLDFRKMVRKADGKDAEETYRLDDKKHSVIHLTGCMEEHHPRVTLIDVSA